MSNGGTRDELKIAVVGAGNVGAASAAVMASRDLGRIWLYDIVEDLAIGKAMDINHASPFFHHDARVTGTGSPNDLAGANVVVLTAGAPRRAGMTRADLLGRNAAVCDAVDAEILSVCPNAKVLVITNPVDALTTYLKDRRPELNVFGLGCTLDMARFRFLLAEAAGAPVDAVDAMVIGAHNDHMMPLIGRATIGGVPAREVLAAPQIAHVIEETRKAGHRIVSRLRDRGSFYAAAHCTASIIAAIAHDTRDVYPLSVPGQGEYCHSDVCLALPCHVCSTGPGDFVRIELDRAERDALDRCASDIRNALRELAGHCCKADGCSPAERELVW